MAQRDREYPNRESGDAGCVCDGWTPQNAAHLYVCPWVGDGSREQVRKDAQWCAAVARFVAWVLNHYVDSGEGRDWLGREERHLVKQEAAVHRHSLDSLNTINDSPPPKKKILRRVLEEDT